MFSLTVCVAGRGQRAVGQGCTLGLSQEQDSPLGLCPINWAKINTLFFKPSCHKNL